MPPTRERLAQGLTYEQFKAQMTRNREQLEANERAVEVTREDIAAFKRAGRLSVLVLAEDWCGDVVANLPVLGRLAAETGTLDVRVFLRDQNDDLMAHYMNGEFKSIPVFVFFDDSLKEIGRFIERPSSVTELREKRRAEVFASDPRFGSPGDPVDRLPADVRTALGAALQRMRDETKAFSNREVLRELGEIVARAA